VREAAQRAYEVIVQLRRKPIDSSGNGGGIRDDALEVGAVHRSRLGRTVLEADNVWFTLPTMHTPPSDRAAWLDRADATVAGAHRKAHDDRGLAGLVARE
jgi:hypothetical protein